MPIRWFTLIAATSLIVGCSSSGSSSDAELARDQISAAGVDPDGELTYEHFFYFADEVDARAAADDLVPDFSVEVFEPGDGVPECGVVAVQSAAPDGSGLEDLTAQLDIRPEWAL